MAWGGPVPGIRQIKVAGMVIANITGDIESPIDLPSFLVMTPDSRLRTKVTILFSGQGINFPAPLGTLYLQEMEQDYTGSGGVLIPSVAIEGTSGTPTTLPKNPGLQGYSKEFVTAGDAIQGFLTLASGFGVGGYVVLQARWQPEGQRIPKEEWDELCQLCSLNATQVNV